MLFFTGKKTDLRDFTPQELETALAKGEVILVDVREHAEHDAARIEGALCHPLSIFDPHTLPEGNVVLHCGVGKRSAMAAERCAKAGVKIAGHLAGGINAWAQAGLPVKRG
jgi:rhodanese-related sulfurtransferase